MFESRIEWISASFVRFCIVIYIYISGVCVVTLLITFLFVKAFVGIALHQHCFMLYIGLFGGLLCFSLISFVLRIGGQLHPG